MKLFLILLLVSFNAFAEPVSHEAVYHVGLDKTAGGASSVVSADGTMRYTLQKACGVWKTETVFSLDISYELSGVETTNWKQTTVETPDGCRFDFEVFARENGVDRMELAGSARCDGDKKKVKITYPATLTADLPKSVKFPLEQTLFWLKAAKDGKKNFSSYVFDGTRATDLMRLHGTVSDAPAARVPPALKGVKSHWFDFAFYPAAKGGDGTPSYESGARYYDNAVADEIKQDFGTYVLRSELTAFKKLPDIRCKSKD